MKTIVAKKHNRVIGYWFEHKILKRTIHLYAEDENIERVIEDAKEYILKRGEPGIELSIETVSIDAAQQVEAERERIKTEIYRVFGDSVVENHTRYELQMRVRELIDSL